MKCRIAGYVGAAVIGMTSAIGCSGELPVTPSSLELSSARGPAGTPAATRSTAPMQVFPAGPELPGLSRLTRNDNGIAMTVQATGLTPGHAYTIWFVIFNSPDECDGPCDVTDVLSNRGLPSLRFGTGHVVGGSGSGNFGGQLAEGNTGGPPCAADANLAICGPGLLDARTAIVHLVVRAHGEAIPGIVNEQIGSFGGGCTVNTCSNVQFAEHRP